MLDDKIMLIMDNEGTQLSPEAGVFFCEIMKAPEKIGIITNVSEELHKGRVAFAAAMYSVPDTFSYFIVMPEDYVDCYLNAGCKLVYAGEGCCGYRGYKPIFTTCYEFNAPESAASRSYYMMEPIDPKVARIVGELDLFHITEYAKEKLHWSKLPVSNDELRSILTFGRDEYHLDYIEKSRGPVVQQMYSYANRHINREPFLQIPEYRDLAEKTIKINECADVWKKALFDSLVTFNIQQKNSSKDDIETVIGKVTEFARFMGIDHMVDAVYQGVPAEDVSV